MRTSAEDNHPGRGTGLGVSSRLYTVPLGRPFLADLARAVLDGQLPAPGGSAPDVLELPDFTIMLPTRRGCRSLQEAFLRVGGGRAMLLPRLRPIAATVEELGLLTAAAGLDPAGPQGWDVPPAMDPLARQLALTELILAWSQATRGGAGDGDDFASFDGTGAATPAQAVRQAAELARLMDLVEAEEASLAGLAALVPDEHAAHWQLTIEFLQIVTEHWPKHLAESGLTSPGDRRNRLIRGEARRLEAIAEERPVIIAGVTGATPAEVELLRTVLSLRRGAVVLPGLDLMLDAESWEAIAPTDASGPGHPEHPQYGLKRLLDALGLSRADVALLPGSEPARASTARASLLAEAMRPAATTRRWQAFAASASRDEVAAALAGLALIEAPSSPDEAEVVALIMREVAETPGRTAALVSPDRLLARRVVQRLEAWGLRVDDSAGRPFAKTPPGAFLDLVIEAVAVDFAPAPLMALLKHPLCRLGLEPSRVRRAARALEIATFRTPYFGEGLDGVAAALESAERKRAEGKRRDRALRRMWREDWAAARELVERLRNAFAPLVEVFAPGGTRPLCELAAAHMAAAEALAARPTEQGLALSSALWEGEAGETAAALFQRLLDASLRAPRLSARDYPDFYRGLLAQQAVRSSIPAHPRLFVWGPFEARLQQPDVLILGSLNEGTWPASTDPGAWLNRPMRRALELPAAEADIGRSAHDFVSLCGAEQVYLTRAEKQGGAPTVPSRWLMRLEALLGAIGLADRLAPERPWLAWARARDVAPRLPPISPPAPCPPVEQRPRTLSVSKVETWIANPYAVFAEAILKLEPLPALGEPPGASLRGSIVHEALSRFARAHPKDLPNDAERELIAIAREILEDYTGHDRVAAFWLTRLERFARWFAQTEAGRRDGVDAVHSEVAGKLVIDAPAGPFTLTARADRIDTTENGLVITDYKTGTCPKDGQVASGFAPQLPLEAAIAAADGFVGVGAAPVTALRYIRASGAEPPGEERTIKVNDVAALAAQAQAGLARLIALYDDAATPYAAVRRPSFAGTYRFDRYAHLARVAEWSAQPEDAEE